MLLRLLLLLLLLRLLLLLLLRRLLLLQESEASQFYIFHLVIIDMSTTKKKQAPHIDGQSKTIKTIHSINPHAQFNMHFCTITYNLPHTSSQSISHSNVFYLLQPMILMGSC